MWSLDNREPKTDNPALQVPDIFRLPFFEAGRDIRKGIGVYPIAGGLRGSSHYEKPA